MQLRNPARVLVRRVLAQRARYEEMIEGLSYGPAQWEPGEWAPHPGYYWLLAGIVDQTGARRVFEAGTHFGGSAFAMTAAGAAVFTCDIRPDGLDRARAHPEVTAVHGDALTGAAACTRAWGSVDLAFVDVDHEGPSTNAAIDAALGLGPGWLVVDDINLNDEMREIWSALRDRFGARRCLDTDAVSEEIRGGGVGFGIVKV